MKTSRPCSLAVLAGTALLAGGCAVVPTPDGGVVVPAPVVVTPPPVVVSPWWGYRSYGYDYGPRYYSGPRYDYGPRYYRHSRPVAPPPRYHGAPGGVPSFPSPMR